MSSPTGSPPSFEPPVLKLFSTGQAVRVLQTKLQIAVDGQFGFGTQKAVKKLQEANGLTADGIVGPDTWKALGWRTFGARGRTPRLSSSSAN